MTHRLALPLTLGVALLCAAAAPTAQAGVVFTNFGPSLAYDTGSGNPVGNAFDGNDYAGGDAFTPSQTGVLSSLRLALSCAFGCADPFNVSLTADNGDQPGTVLENFTVQGTALGAFALNNPPLLLTSLVHPQLHLGTQYWVAISSPISDAISWNLNTSGDSSDQAISTDGGATWFSPSGNTPSALEVSVAPAATTPEPGTLAFLLGGAMLLALRRPVLSN